jgi:hypothetical protein
MNEQTKTELHYLLVVVVGGGLNFDLRDTVNRIHVESRLDALLLLISPQ